MKFLFPSIGHSLTEKVGIFKLHRYGHDTLSSAHESSGFHFNYQSIMT